MSRLPSWHFREMDAGEVHVDPVHDEFFKMQDLADALVRESIQNSLDARRPRSSVRVRFRFATGSDALSSAAAGDYFDSLRPHLAAAEIHSVLPKANEDVPYLLIEDFGTRGLTGDPAIDPELDADSNARNDFFYFWRNVGRSNKGDLDRGRWGLGKAVFTVASRIRTIFGLTVRADDTRALLLGQSVLKTHILDETRIYPYGFFARFERKNSLPLPIDEPMLLERFADDFQLHRREPGLSIVVPYYRDDELTFERIAASVIAQYFYPILRGELTVVIEHAARKETINAATIASLATLYAGSHAGAVERLCALTRWSLSPDAMRVELPPVERTPQRAEDLTGEELAEELRARFDRGERVAVRVPLSVKRKKARTAAASWFDVFLEKDDALRGCEFHYIRRGITIPEVKSRAAGDKPVRALIVVDDDALSTFLGDAENPAHSDWSERADKLKTQYDKHAFTLRTVKNAPALLATILSRPPAGRARDFLQDLFFLEQQEDDEVQTFAPRIAGDGDDSAVAAARDTSVSRPQNLAISRVAGGFTISGVVPNESTSWIAEAAYRVRSGNPFRKHSTLDFDLRGGAAGFSPPCTVESRGVIIEPLRPNAIRFTPTAEKFQITMKGFDPRRDLIVRVLESTGDAAEAELH